MPPPAPPPSAKSTKDSQECNIKVAVRVRPRNDEEKVGNSAIVVETPNASSVEVKVKTGIKFDSKTYGFDHVFPSDCSQLEVFQGVVSPMIDEVLMGYNCTVFAYGQTGTGKTYTMEGIRSEIEHASHVDDVHAGVIPRSLQLIFEKLECGESEFTIRVSCLEIYNEELFDLISPQDEKLRLFEDGRSKGSVIIQGLEEVTLYKKSDIYDIIARAAEKRRTSETKMNKQSSRSHSVFTVTVHQKENTVTGEEVLKTGKLNLVDLAGSENIGRSGAVKDRAREAGSINQSLLTLGRVISLLVERAPHIPYRESKLTRLLQDSLGGRTKTSIVATVSPASINLEETLSTLDYASRAKNILNRPELNQKLTKRALIKEYTEEIDRLKADLLATREKNGVYLSSETYSSMVSEIEGQKSTITEMTDKVEALEEEINKISTLFENTSKRLEATSQQLTETTATLQATETTLVQTKDTLTTRTKERDQQTFYSDHLKSVESSLTSHGNELIEVADLTSTHVEGLHEKISRKGSVLESNNEATAQFYQGFSSSLGDMQQIVHTLYEGQQTTMAALHNELASFSKNFRDTTSQFQLEVKGASEGMQGGVASLQQENTRHVESMTKWSSAFSQNITHHAAEVEKNVVEFEKGSMNESNTALISTIQKQEELLASFTQRMEDQLKASLSTLSNNLSAYESRMQSLQNVVMNFCSSQETIMAEHQKAASETLVSQKEDSTLALDMMKTQIHGLLDAFLASQLQGFGKNISFLTSKVTQLSENNQTFNAEYQAKMKEDRECACRETEEMTHHLSVAQTMNNDASSTLKGTMVDLREQQLPAHHSLVAGYHMDLVSMARGHKEASLATLQEHERHVASYSTSQSMLIEEQADREEVLVEQIEKYNVAQLDTEAFFSTSQDEVREEQTKRIETFNTEMSTRFTTMGAALEEYATQTIKNDHPTGKTPQRQVYSYPRVLPKSKPFEIICEEFDSHMVEIASSNEMVLSTPSEAEPEPVSLPFNNPSTHMEASKQIVEKDAPLVKEKENPTIVNVKSVRSSKSSSKLPVIGKRPLETINS